LKFPACGAALVAVGVVAAIAVPATGFAQATSGHVLITAPIDDNQTVSLDGNTRPEATPANDRGPVPGSLALKHMLLQLNRSPGDEAAVERYIDALHDPASPLFHRWLSAAEFGERFGLSQADVGRVSSWLSQHGFTVERVYSSRMVIAFSGTAQQVATAFHTSVHYLDVAGVRHYANMTDPRIPAALAPAVAGITSLHDFHPQNRRHPRLTTNGNLCNAPSGSCYLVGPGDLETIYNFRAAYAKGYTGKGISVAVVEDTDLYDNAKDWKSFVATFALGSYGGTFTLVHPACTDPGSEGDNASDEGEAALDAQWATAAAPGANILFASCEGATTDGVTQAIVNLVHEAKPPPIISVSYGVCETEDGAAANRTYFNAYQVAVAAGISVFVATGDNGPSDCAGSQNGANVGIGINGWGDTIYNVAVGGTDFSDEYTGNPTKYWLPNSGGPWLDNSAKSYIPETPWNDTCAGTLLALYMSGSSRTYGSTGFCNAGDGTAYRELGGGEGGPSGCATGSPAVAGVVGGTCKGYAKPTWQSSVFGYINDGVRDVPDVSMFASDGAAWGHVLISCFSDPAQGGTPCTGNPANWAGDAGGTSFATPIVAGIQALVNQSLGLTAKGVGNPNTVYYKLAATEYGNATTRAACNSSKGTSMAKTCVFNNITLGDDDIDCTVYSKTKPVLYNCYRPSGAFGVLSTSNTAYAPAYLAKAGFNLPTGLGSINVANLIANWPH
jgi:subtilase family serine protease